MAIQKRYQTKPLSCWSKAKELRLKYYKNYAQAKEKGGLRWAGGAWSFDAIPAGLGDDVYPLTSEPYGASIGNDPQFCRECQEAIEAKGFARDLCAYMRNYWGSIVLNRFYFGGEWPKPDFIFQDHICCSHAKWYQVVCDLEPDIPYFCVDVSVGPYKAINERKISYVAGQLLDGIDWLQKVTKRKYDDEKLIQAVHNHFRSTSLWAECCAMNKAIPAPLDEKTMYSLYVLGTLVKSSKEVADFYQELRDEVKYRMDNQIAAVATERCRVMTDSQPPWAFLGLWRYLEQFGVISIGSLYTFGLIGAWDRKPDGTLEPARPPSQQGLQIRNREEAVHTLAEWELKKLAWAMFYGADFKNELTLDIVRQWHCQGVIIHLNRGCEGSAIYQMETKNALVKAGIPAMTYEGNMADTRDFDEARTIRRLDVFLKETMGLHQLES